jgi:high-affinity Fe2+/Pb2+ permease
VPTISARDPPAWLVDAASVYRQGFEVVLFLQSLIAAPATLIS